jgi:RNA polymerase sigma factor (TIGR02999 family)
MNDLPQILNVVTGDPTRAEQLLPLVYDELRKLAAEKIAHENPGQTLQATALVHEAYLRLSAGNRDWNGRGHFFAAAAEAMRRILIENARRKRRLRHGGKFQRLAWDEADALAAGSSEELLELDDALEKLAQHDSEAASLVKLRLFAGLSIEQAAEALGLSRTTAYRHWTYARAWLYSQLHDPAEDGQGP